MKGRLFLLAWLVLCVLQVSFSPSPALAVVDAALIRMAPPWQGLDSYTLTLFSDGAPFVAAGAIEIFGNVHQANRYGTIPTVFLDQVPPLPTYAMTCDTHLLFTQSQVIPLPPFIVETNSMDNPSGLPLAGTLKYGRGTFGQSLGGEMSIMPPYRSTTIDLLQLVTVAFDPPPSVCLQMVTADDVVHSIEVSPNWSGSVMILPPVVDFGNVRVGTTANDILSAHIESENPVERDGLFWGRGAFGPRGVECYLSSEYSSDVVSPVFSPTSRGQFSETGVLTAGPDIEPGQVELRGTGVGPVFGYLAAQAPDMTIEFGDGPVVESCFDVFFGIGNMTDDPELGSLTKLTAVATIEDDAAGAFEILDGNLFDLLTDQTDEIHLRFNTDGLAAGEYEATLVLQTDVGAPVGATTMGEVYSFTLHAAVPEPGTLGLLMVLGVVLGAIRHRR